MIVLVCAALVCFGIVCSYGFTNTEDEGLITRNPMFNPPTAATLRQIWTTPHLYLYVPATYTAWWLLASVGRTSVADESGATLNPWLFHSANLAMHVAASLLVLALLRRLTRGREGPALIGALIFAIHPIQAEAVAWTTGMKDTLCGVFAFAALLMFVRHTRDTGVPPMREAGGVGEPSVSDPSRNQHGRDARVTVIPFDYVAGTFFLLLAMLAKPAAVVVPVMAVIIDRFLLDRPWRSVARRAALWFVLTVPFVVIARVVQPAADLMPAPLWARPLVAGDALAFYFGKLVWPVGLTTNYGRTPEAILTSGAAYWTWLVPAVVAIILWRVKSGPLTAAALLFSAGLLPVLGLTTFLYQQFSTVADRFVYLSMLGVALATAWLTSRRWDRLTVAVASAILLMLGVLAFRQATVWENRVTLYGHLVAVRPDDPSAHSVYAGALKRAGRLDEAIEQLEIVMRLMPNDDTRALLEQWRAERSAE